MSTPSSANILSLSDDVLLYILKQLDNLQVLYSLIGVNRQLDRVARDVKFTHSLDLAELFSNKANEGKADAIFERFCLEILPRIQHLVECLTLHPHSIDRVLRAGSYPQLRRLIVVDARYNMICTIPNDYPAVERYLCDRISHLAIVLNKQLFIEENTPEAVRIFANLPIELRRVTHLQVDTEIFYRPLPPLLFDFPSTVCWSSTITHLNLKLATFDPCLYLLDGRLRQLHTLNVCVYRVERNTTMAPNTQILSSLKCFSLRCHIRATAYEQLIVPCIGRMSDLETLTLALTALRRVSFIDGTQLVNDILDPLTNLRTFTFNIISEGVTIADELPPPSATLSRALVERGYDLECYTSYNVLSRGQCHLYSLPFNMDRMYIHSIRFPGGLFSTVQYLHLLEFVEPFEHEFFLHIAHWFPLVRHLVVFNRSSQKKTGMREERDVQVVEFPHVISLAITGSWIDYGKQFLFDRRTRLPSLRTLRIDYRQLSVLTNYFTNDAARVNCAKVQHLLLEDQQTVYPHGIALYFPSCKNKFPLMSD